MNKHRYRVHFLLAIGLSSTLLTPVCWAQAAADCDRILIKDPQPQWISSAVEWSGKVAAADPARNAILLIGRDGTQVYDPKKLVDSAKDMMPTFINKTPNGYAVQMADRRLFWMDAGLNKVGFNRLDEPVPNSPEKIISTYYSVSTAANFLSIGAVKEANGRVDYGFFHAPQSNPSHFTFLKDWTDVDYYLLSHRYMTGLGADEYAVLMASGKTASIVNLSAGGKQVGVIPAAYRNTPKLNNETTGPSSQEALFKTIEGFSIPVGLYGQDGFLYLLTREPGKERGKTIWRLFQIDPSSKQEPRGVVLPTDAHHLSVANSADTWYFIEKGPVLPLGKQEATSMFMIPNSLIRTLSVPSTCRTAQ
ncbi:MAG TPA: hypothetical protein VIE43_16370 [Thermoanaerobaculia bacterium]|jgi:hypothetical protein|nr:hypothetical protein [Thermoanaerobaculia bacterium]